MATRVLPIAGLVLCVLIGGCGGSGGGGGPAEIVVTNLNDAGDGSLRQALVDVRSGGRVLFDPALVGILLLASTLLVDKDVTIDGPGALTIALSGGTTLRILEVALGARVAIRRLTFLEGGGGSGAGILSSGTLTLEDVRLESCVAPGTGRGGGLRNVGGVATLLRCAVTGCGGFNGGGIANDQGGTMTIRDSAIWENATTGNSGAGLLCSSSTLVVVNSTISGNVATGGSRVGGGLAVFPSDGDATASIYSCTFTGNEATGNGGGIYLDDDPPFLGTLEIRNSVVAQNLSGSGGPDIHAVGTVTSGGNNVVGDGTDSGLVHGVNGDQVGTSSIPIDPMLGPLADNGGPTLTHLPLPGSPARDAVPVAACVDDGGGLLTVDQRGTARPQGAACDAGSVEAP